MVYVKRPKHPRVEVTRVLGSFVLSWIVCSMRYFHLPILLRALFSPLMLYILPFTFGLFFFARFSHLLAVLSRPVISPLSSIYVMLQPLSIRRIDSPSLSSYLCELVFLSVLCRHSPSLPLLLVSILPVLACDNWFDVSIPCVFT